MAAPRPTRRPDLEVHLGASGLVVGRLHLGSGRRSAFSYDEGWLRDARFFTLSPDLQPVAGVQHPRQVFFLALEDTAPDAWGERVIRRAHAKLRQEDRDTPALDPVDFVMWVDDEARVGALRLFDPQSGAYLRAGGANRHVPPLVELDKVLHAARALFLGALGLSFLAERRLPYQPRWNRPHADRLRDVLHASVNESLNALGILALPLLAGVLGFWPVWPQAWPLWLQLLLAIVLADLGITLVHYASHRSALLWRLHAVHHSVQRLYSFNGLMKHPLHLGLEALGGTLPLLLLGVPQTVAALLAFAIGIQLLLQHSNVDMRIGGLRHVFAWAPLHRLHHIRYGRAGDVNFALFFSVWDRLLGTALHRPDYRLDSTDMGIGDQPDYPRDYAGQLLAPFRDLPRSRHVPQPPEGLGRSAGQA